MRVAITGASRGLGLGLCEVLASRGDEVVALCRRSTPEPDALGVQVLEGSVMDIGMHRSVLAAGRGNPSPGVSPVDAAREVVARLDELDLASTGSWLNRSGEPIALDGSGLAGMK